MSVTLITGQPGSGKTLYTIAQLIKPLMGTTVEVEDDDGSKRTVPRKLYSNINGLLLEHELVEHCGAWVLHEKKWVFSPDPRAPLKPLHDMGWHHWPRWAEPGALLVVDEFQKIWPPRPNGAAIPPDVEAFDTHRHMGVDFILITQDTQQFDRHLIGRIDRHLHVRRVANMHLAVVYEWDHVSRSLLYRNSISKTPWRYPRWAMKLYKSARAHTKQSRQIPTLVWFILAGLAAFAYLGPTTWARINERVSGGTDKPAQIAPADKPVQPGQVDPAAPGALRPQDLPAVPGQPEAMPVLSGCVATKTDCRCYTPAGERLDVQPDMCWSLQTTSKPLAANALPSSNLPTLAQADYLQSLKDSGGPLRAE